MAPKNREYYLTTSPGRDFNWFSFRTPATARPSTSKAEPTPMYRVSKPSRAKMPSIAEEPNQALALMAPVDVKAMVATVKPKLGTAKPKKSKSRKPVLKTHSPWSDWYVSEDRGYFWRARVSPNETWDYQFTPGSQPQLEPQVEPQVQLQPHPQLQPQSQPQSQSRSSSTSSSSLSSSPNRPISPSPGPATSPSRTPNPTSPKSSWPTIITTSTGQRTADMSTSSTQTLTTLTKEVGDSKPATPSTALVPVIVITKPPLSRNNTNNTNKPSTSKRPVGPVMRLLQEGRSRKAKTKSDVTITKSITATTAAAASTAAKGGGGSSKPQVQQQQQGITASHGNNGTNGTNGGGGAVIITKARTAYSKKLHARVKAEKELKVDPKRRVRGWLKDVEGDGIPVVLDGEGLPVYR